MLSKVPPDPSNGSKENSEEEQDDSNIQEGMDVVAFPFLDRLGSPLGEKTNKQSDDTDKGHDDSNVLNSPPASQSCLEYDDEGESDP